MTHKKQNPYKLTFRLYHAEGGKMAFAAQVTDENIDLVKQHWWKNGVVFLGDFIIMRGNGDIELYNETDFGDKYSRGLKARVELEPDEKIEI